MATLDISGGTGSPFAGAPQSVPGAPLSIPGAPHSVPGGPTTSFPNFLTTVERQDTAGEFRDLHTSQIRDFQGRYAGAWGIAWQGLAAMSEGIFDYGKRIEVAKEDAMKELAKSMEDWARENAPWEDQTGNARRDLQSVVVTDGSRTVIFFGHGKNIPYGIWLETMQGGRFAIVLPTVTHFAPMIAGRVAAHV